MNLHSKCPLGRLREQFLYLALSLDSSWRRRSVDVAAKTVAIAVQEHS